MKPSFWVGLPVAVGWLVGWWLGILPGLAGNSQSNSAHGVSWMVAAWLQLPCCMLPVNIQALPWNLNNLARLYMYVCTVRSE
jgi:hypothetical protein